MFISKTCLMLSKYILLIFNEAHIIAFVPKLLSSVRDTLMPLLDSGVCESVVCVLRQLSDAPLRPNDLGGDESDLLWQEVTSLVVLLVQRAFR